MSLMSTDNYHSTTYNHELFFVILFLIVFFIGTHG